MIDIVPNESANVTIAVCGEQGSGKTVFLTCIFQSIWTACPDDVILDFDRHEIGNADYFRDIEERLIQNGSPDQGTLPHSVFPARIYVKPYGPRPQSLPPVLSVDIQDFAGRHFRSLANLKALGAPRESEPDDVKALRTVNETLKKADAFVILINAKQIDPLNATPTANPFTPSVNFLLAHCRAERKPVALLFTQVDQTPMLTEEVFRSMPRVEAFKRQFTENHDEAAAGDRPFGIVRPIACYETVPGDLAPVRQSLDGSIWKPEPAQVVLDLMRAAMPRINARLAATAAAAATTAAAAAAEAAAAARRQREEAELANERARRRRRILTAAAAVALVLTASAIALFLRARHENQQVQLLAGVAATMSGGRLSSLAPDSEARLADILNAYRSDRGGTSREIRGGIRDVHRAFAEAARRLADEPSFDPAYTDQLVRFRRLATLLDPENTAEWRPTLQPLLDGRTEFLSEWFARDNTTNERSALLENAIRQFSTGDVTFARVLASQSNRARTSKAAA